MVLCCFKIHAKLLVIYSDVLQTLRWDISNVFLRLLYWTRQLRTTVSKMAVVGLDNWKERIVLFN